MILPDMAIVEQDMDSTGVKDLFGEISGELRRLEISKKVESGHRVGIAAGSRGVSNMAQIIRILVEYFKDIGADPFIFPAMGSHGGATPEGQLEVLADFGISEKKMGCRVRATMEVRELRSTLGSIPVFVDDLAARADHIVVVNRIKSHTEFNGKVESGLLKMLSVGLSNDRGAQVYHQTAIRDGLERVICDVSRVVLEEMPVLMGLAVVENSSGETALLKALLPDEIETEEMKLLVEAKKRMGHLPFADIDLLIIQEMGKDISGAGMDTNVIGWAGDVFHDFPVLPKAKRLAVLDLTDKSEGNALGIGMADFTTEHLVNKIDREKTYINCVLSLCPEKAAIPMYFGTDKACLEAALDTVGPTSSLGARVVLIKNTADLKKMAVSKAYKSEMARRSDLKLITDWKAVCFGPDGELLINL